jgi:DTW domain-containing protein YfiP
MGSHGHDETSFPSPSPSTRRPVCAKCNKPVKLCLCCRFTSAPLDNSISVTVLQHTHEVKHPLNSTRVAKLGFKNISVIHVSDVNLHAQLEIQPLKDVLSGSELTRLGNSSSNTNCCENLNGKSENSSSKGECMDPAPIRLATSGGENGNSVIDRCRENPKPGRSSSNAGMELSSDSSASAVSSCCGGANVNCIVKEMNKYKIVCSPTSLTITVERTAKPNLNWIPKTLIGKSLIDSGFRVKKLHTKKKSNSAEIYEIMEYDMIVPPNSVLLFPNEKSVGLDSVDCEVKNLIVLDGTWGKAQRMYNENPWLKLLPHLKLDSKQESLYSEVRHEPKSGCLSTIESIIFALKKFGEDTKRLDMILGVFESMILDQRRCKDENFLTRLRLDC